MCFAVHHLDVDRLAVPFIRSIDLFWGYFSQEHTKHRSVARLRHGNKMTHAVFPNHPWVTEIDPTGDWRLRKVSGRDCGHETGVKAL